MTTRHCADLKHGAKKGISHFQNPQFVVGTQRIDRTTTTPQRVSTEITETWGLRETICLLFAGQSSNQPKPWVILKPIQGLSTWSTILSSETVFKLIQKTEQETFWAARKTPFLGQMN
jgi:hypothetical protein